MAGNFSACVSPHIFTDVPNGVHTIDIRAKDTAGNITSAATFPFTFTQQFHDTVALYHFDSGADLVDSSYYAQVDSPTLFDNTLTIDLATALATGVFAEGRDFVAAVK